MVRASARKARCERAVARAPFPRYLSALARLGGLAAEGSLGNGVMVTLRFLVPSF
jgi:hypothetical protein